MIAIFKREFRSYFSTPVGYIVLAAFYFFLGLYFCTLYEAGAPDIVSTISFMSTISVFAVPILTMRLMSEDRRQKVDQALLTAPVRLSGIVLGKYFAALAVFALGFVPTLIFQMIFASLVAGLQWFPYLYSLFGMLLLGGALIAIGMFLSCLTESAVIAAILTLVTNIVVLFMSAFASMAQQISWLSGILEKAAFINAYENFSKNIFSVTDVLYFVSIIAAFLFLCVRALDARRWS